MNLNHQLLGLNRTPINLWLTSEEVPNEQIDVAIDILDELIRLFTRRHGFAYQDQSFLHDTRAGFIRTKTFSQYPAKFFVKTLQDIENTIYLYAVDSNDLIPEEIKNQLKQIVEQKINPIKIMFSI